MHTIIAIKVKDSDDNMSELEEVRHLLSQATYPGVVALLKAREQELEKQKQTEKQAEVEVPVVEDKVVVDEKLAEVAVASSKTVPLKQDVKVAAPPARSLASGGRVVYTPITDFAWDQDGYDSPVVTVYVDLSGVGSVKDNVSCDFTKSSFDLQVLGLDGKNYRLLKDNLDKDIVPEKSRIIVKKNKVVVKLQKVKGTYSYESW